MEQKKTHSMSRRDFIKGAAAGAVAVASSGMLATIAGAADGTNSSISWDRTVDVVVVGGGGSGLAAAYEAAAAGASVLVLEKDGKTGGTTAVSGGLIQGSSSYQKDFGVSDDSPEKHAACWIAEAEGYIDESLVKDMANGAPSHIEFIVKTLGAPITDLYGHAHIPYVDNSLYADRIHAISGGAAKLTEALLQVATEKGAVIELNTEVTCVYADANGEVMGVAATADGKSTNIKAGKCVILATSSIDWNEDMAREMSPQQYWNLKTQTCACAKTITGDGIRMGMALGAAVAGFGGCVDISSKTSFGVNNQAKGFPCFMVNKSGMRFVCEDATYAYVVRAVFQQETQTCHPTYTIFGEGSFVEGATWTKESAEKDAKDGNLVRADTIEALAEAIGVDADGLKVQLDLWNAMAAKGKDTQYDRWHSVEAITGGPYYAHKNGSLNLGAIGGLKINTDAQVIGVSGAPIPRLYAVGMNSGGWIGPYYPGSGTAVMGCMHWGRKAGVNAAKLTNRE